MQADLCLFELALQAWPSIWLFDLLRYLVPATLVACLLALLPARWRARRSVQGQTPADGQRRREFLNSMLTVLIFSANGALIFAGAKAGVMRLYTDIGERGWAYAGISLIVLVLAHDTWFYWTHRLLHRRWLFRWSHLTHHRSIAPTPWAAYSFAPAEAVVQAVFLSLILLVLPLHPLVIFVFLTHMIVRNVLGHAGVELMPRAWLAGWWGRRLTTTLHHDLHHLSRAAQLRPVLHVVGPHRGTEHRNIGTPACSLVGSLDDTWFKACRRAAKRSSRQTSW
jgi:sterol desaturase/sphingolipid hydroxylase (fatty acid hydroxylase superfamily)